MKTVGAIANVQPMFVTSDAAWLGTRLGGSKESERWRFAYAWKTLLDAGVVVAGGSDAPIEDPNPFCKFNKH
jgi:predicted amidohydrolase YtcJ